MWFITLIQSVRFVNFHFATFTVIHTSIRIHTSLILLSYALWCCILQFTEYAKSCCAHTFCLISIICLFNIHLAFSYNCASNCTFLCTTKHYRKNRTNNTNRNGWLVYLPYHCDPLYTFLPCLSRELWPYFFPKWMIVGCRHGDQNHWKTVAKMVHITAKPLTNLLSSDPWMLITFPTSPKASKSRSNSIFFGYIEYPF